MTRVLVAGATGLVGGLVLGKALADPRIVSVVAPTRRALPAHRNLINPVVDFSALPDDAEWWAVDGVVAAFGTTRALTPSQAAYRIIDHDYPVAVGQLALRHGAKSYALVSAMGAHAQSTFFYPRLKGEVERDVLALGYPSTTLVRPGFIGGADRKEERSGESIMTGVLGALAPVLPRRYRISQADRIASVLLEAVISAAPGRHIIEADALAE